MVIDYITKVNKAISNSMVVVEKEDIFDLLIEIANVFQNEIPADCKIKLNMQIE